MKIQQSVPFTRVDLKHGFWHDRQELNSSVTIYSIQKRFQQTGRFDAFRFDWKEGMPNRPHIFWDSDIAKWIEAAAYILEKKEDPSLEEVIDQLVDLIEAHQDPSGYFNIWFTVGEPDKRFKNRTDHELYCAGHLLEAAVAYYHFSGKDKFLRLMCKYADYIEKAFMIEQSAAFATPGHEEIELALYKLYQCTGEIRYLNLSKWFLDNRGKHEKDNCIYEWANPGYLQDHLPVREQDTAEGHAVRAMYLYCAMADIAGQYNDASLLNACYKLFENVVTRRMYITGGIGSSRVGEAFTVDYDLPNVTAYAESCAAISLAMFARRMLLLDCNSLYSDTIERVIYNGFLSSTSLDGKAFFYENPLEINPLLYVKDHTVKQREFNLPITQRVEVFDCSCCPPNIARFIASIGDYLYTQDDSTLFIHQFMDSLAALSFQGKPFTVTQTTEYPMLGKVTVNIDGAKGIQIALRIPGWCDEYQLIINGELVNLPTEKGYCRFLCPSDNFIFVLDMKMEPQLIEASPLVQDNVGKVALQKGPIVYCIEGVDNGDDLKTLFVDRNLSARSAFDTNLNCPVLDVKGWRKDDAPFRSLYQKLTNAFLPQTIRFIPYYTFANRGESQMLVWVNLR